MATFAMKHPPRTMDPLRSIAHITSGAVPLFAPADQLAHLPLSARITPSDAPLQAASAAAARLISSKDIPITTDYTSPELPAGTVSYHRLFGLLVAQHCYWLSSYMELADNLRAADANPAITAHLLHISSPGGEAYYLDAISAVIRSLTKPVVAHVEKVAASAAYWIASAAKAVYATTPFDTLGSIGIMSRFVNWDPAMEKEGARIVEIYATRSPMKNQAYREAISGHPDRYRTEVIDPLADSFVAHVRAHRQALAALPDDHPALQGQSYFATEAAAIGLIDGIQPIAASIQYAASLTAHPTTATRAKAYSLIQ